MNDLVAYVQSLGNKRGSVAFVEAPDEYSSNTEAGRKLIARKTVDTNSSAAANAGRGIYTQNCAICHGLEGWGNGPNALSLEKKPANFSRAFYKQYPDEQWFYRISEGVAGTRMPRFQEVLTEEQRWYLVAYLKTLQLDTEHVVDNIDQLDKVEQIKLPKLSHEEYEPHTGNY
jgi:mono/diheme cytochrome c family protein